jgi:hypothetical protein
LFPSDDHQDYPDVPFSPDAPPQDFGEQFPMQPMQQGEPSNELEYVPNYGPQYEGTHQENLAEFLDDSILQDISNELVQQIEDDLDSRDEWVELLEEGIEQLGFKTEEKEFPFQGAANVFSPAFRQAYLSFGATFKAECLPPQGPVKTTIVGDANDEINSKGQRVESWMNYFLTEVAKEYYPDTEQAGNWCALQGSVFKKTYFDPVLRRPTSLYVKPQNFIVNFGASTLANATRVTELLTLTKKDLRLRQLSGMYRDIELSPADSFMMEDDQIQNKVESLLGLEKPSYDLYDDKVYKVYECHANIIIEGMQENISPELQGIPLPYVITIDVQSEKILSIYRNWKEGDLFAERVEHYTHFIFIPGLGFYGYGLAHIAGGDAKAATIILRQLIDAGMLNNFPGGVRVAGMRVRDNNIRVGPMEFVEIETGHLKIQEAIMPFPFKGPDPILFELLKKQEEAVLSSFAAGNSPLADFNPNAPVGTTLALLEQSHKVQSSIMSRLHDAFKNEFKLLFKLFGECLPETPYPFNVPGGQSAIMRADFDEQINIIPVSNPNLSSNTQRLIIWEAVLKNADAHPDLHNMREVIKKFYEALKLPDIDSILTPPPEDAKPMDPVTEVQHAIVGKAIAASIEQDHASHIAIKSAALQDPSLQQANPNAQSILQANIQEHIAFQYMLQMQQAMGFQMPEDPSQLQPEQQNQIAMAAAQVVQQQQQQKQEQAPPDPAMLSAQAMMEDVKVKAQGIEVRQQEAEMNNQVQLMKLKNEFDLKQAQLAKDQMELEHKMKMEEMRLEVERMKLEMQMAQKESELLQKEQQLELKKHESERSFHERERTYHDDKILQHSQTHAPQIEINE